MPTIEELEARITDLENRSTRNEMVAVALSRIIFSQGILPLTPDLKALLIPIPPPEGTGG